LNEFEKSHPQYSEVVKGLLRSYDGIFDFPSAINETQLAKFIVIKKEKLIQILNELKSLGIIDYSPQKEKPQIYFLKNRVRTSDLFINQKNILNRKNAFEKRLDAIIDFCNNKSNCRSVMIGRYFNDQNIVACRVCDNCLRNQKLNISTEEFNSISSEIKKICFEQPVSKTNLLRKLSTVKENKISKVLTFLQEENLITVNDEGLIRVK
jgi:ATP-dependent DNA helicase RecQ